MEYIDQNLKSKDCSIVGAYNAMIWLKRKADYDKIEKLAKRHCKYSPEIGLKYRFLKRFMRFVNIPVLKLYPMDISKLESYILNGNAVLGVINQEGQKEKHMLFLKPAKNRKVEVLNFYLEWDEIVMEILKGSMRMEFFMLDDKK